MRILLDESLPRRLIRELPGHFVSTVTDNGDLQHAPAIAQSRVGSALRLVRAMLSCTQLMHPPTLTIDHRHYGPVMVPAVPLPPAAGVPTQEQVHAPPSHTRRTRNA